MKAQNQFKILVVDDEEIFLTKFVKKLTNVGYQVQGATDGEAALTVLSLSDT